MNSKYEIINRKISFLPHRPGCYLMKNKDNKIIYVGKAKVLFNRVSQYFQREQTGKVKRMVEEITDFDIIETDNEKEALLLEINLIQEHYPKYNLMLKDGRMYPFIALKKDRNPYLRLVYHDSSPKEYLYFGPYPNSKAARSMINLLNNIFPLRKCSKLPNRPCIHYYMEHCLAPCVNNISQETLKNLQRNVIKFLNGDNSEAKRDLTKKMYEASEKENYELAQTYKVLLESIDHINSNQKIMMKDHVDRDIVGYSTREGYICVLFLLYRKGVLLGKESYIFEEEDIIEEQLTYAITQYYQNHPKPKELLIANHEIVELLSETLGIKVFVPSRGQKKDLLFLTLENAKKALDDHFLTARLNDNNLALLNELKEKLNLEKTPLTIELYDNSHTNGSNSIGAMVKFINGVRSPENYRKYNIHSDNTKDDLLMMKEVLSRRFNRLSQEPSPNYPDLIIVDGGENQIIAAKETINNFQDCYTKIAGLVKNDRHETEGLIDGKTLKSIPIAKGTPLFFFLMRMQDEVHHYAINNHRIKRGKSLFADIFSSIKGIGKKRAAMLQDAYPSFNSLTSVSKQELMQILPEEQADKLLELIKEKQKQGFGIQ